MINSNMPLLEKKISESEVFSDVVVLHINHCMNNSFYFSEQLLKVFCDVVFVAVPYNNKTIPQKTNYTAYHASKKDGFFVLKRNGEAVESSDGDFFSVVCRLIEFAFENEILNHIKNGKKVLIIEDGGYHYSVIKKLYQKYADLKNAILGVVEQTTAGTVNACKQDFCGYPTFSVSRSDYKVRIEAYFVARRIVDEAVRMLHSIDEFLDFRPVLLIGYGIVGRAVAFALKERNVQIYVNEIDKEILASASDDGFCPVSEDDDFVFPDNCVVFGNTGKNSFTKNMLNNFMKSGGNRIFLISTSSKQIEFSDVFSCFEKAVKHRKINGYCEEYIFSDKKSVVLLAEGYPINFYDKTADSLTFDMIDPVFTELFLTLKYILCKTTVFSGKTEILGSKQSLALNDFIKEEDLIFQWKNLNGLIFDEKTVGVHPCEEKLKMKIFEN